MVKQYRVAVVGNRDAILPFRMIGFDIFPVTSGEAAKVKLRELAKEDYGIIYLTEDFAQEIPEIIQFYDTVVTPAVILIPTHRGQLGIGKQRIQDNVEKAVGMNIL
ncbi:V-type ATP synthase subunit F [Aerococcaceae bacterium zg-ZJ1578]|uniref:V-type ATP synthase subunit F n=1 Tax=Aerococcaceae TaxID=186827 RepID=UPI0013BD1972|nr:MULTISPECIES: V-type ATP synthase subunit F [unclassified Facklamia]MBK0348113.1 V-type ATP synthase subunit F [Aerococcaceae bacterium zg-1578]MBR7927332.1 V-type ATP synthase subunit F [Aerococcaceae bacterium zg-ZUI334]MBS4461465.1 V-type ATP synthase subunit F [Aerococcaceae bacterium zg-B36]QQD65772.1 V-type ATP synthase subunit F [Aerococcaceae bacterium zg-252]NEW64063.1 V-type ATP synthase subunit F [Facklamia sp. 252]